MLDIIQKWNNLEYCTFQPETPFQASVGGRIYSISVVSFYLFNLLATAAEPNMAMPPTIVTNPMAFQLISDS